MGFSYRLRAECGACATVPCVPPLSSLARVGPETRHRAATELKSLSADDSAANLDASVKIEVITRRHLKQPEPAATVLPSLRVQGTMTGGV